MSRGPDSPAVGEAWEARAARFLEHQGLTIIARRYRCRLGELDLVASDGSGLVIVEVKARGHGGSSLASIGAGKRRRIVNATRHFLMRHNQWHDRPIRFDVIGFDEIDSNQPRMRWIRSAFDAA
ncbi:MAG TPA: YraN family protein [Gammaproteobacteria bacterium]|jgi:putative endonuclease